MNTVHAVITAAGSSSRMGGVDKLLLPLEGLPLLLRTAEPFLSFPSLGRLVVAVNKERMDEFRRLFSQYFPSSMDRITLTAGGIHRQESILFALRELSQSPSVEPGHPVLIHDGARPFISHELFVKLLNKLGSADGVIPALPVRDTVKRVEAYRVLHTEDRDTLRLVQTPQVFALDRILSLHERAALEGFLGTDDASLLEHYGGETAWIEGPICNLKVTVPEDIALLIHLFREQEKSVKERPQSLE